MISADDIRKKYFDIPKPDDIIQTIVEDIEIRILSQAMLKKRLLIHAFTQSYRKEIIDRVQCAFEEMGFDCKISSGLYMEIHIYW